MNNAVSGGGCLCGAVRYQVTGPSLKVASCHCSLCRRHSGAAFLTYAAYPAGRVRFIRGRPEGYRSSQEAVRGHCATCGSPLTFVFDAEPETLWLTVGSLDDPNPAAPSEHWYVADKVDWLKLNDGLPQWPAGPE